MSERKHILWFHEVNKHDVGIVGGKGANLGEMLQAGFPVPFGFVVTAQAYFYMIDHNKLDHDIRHFITLINFENPSELSDGSAAIRRLIRNAEIPHDLLNQIHKYYHHLTAEEARIYKKHPSERVLRHLTSALQSPEVAVRSSATAEDLPDASFAGQQESYLNVKGENMLVDKIRSAWASLFTERAMYYRQQKHFDHMKVGLAAVVQRMVRSDVSGVAFSIDPITNDKTTVTIEAIHGLGDYIVQGNVTPDHYEVSKKTFEITKKEIKVQKIKEVRTEDGVGEEKVPASMGASQKLPDDKIVQLAKILTTIEDHYYFPQDIEWAMEKGQLFITQSRPITTMAETRSAEREKNKNYTDIEIGDHTILVTGSPASPGIGMGRPVIIMSPDEIDKIHAGDVLVAPMTDPDYVPAMKKAAAIVTEMGGRTSHAAIVSRELGIPAVVGAQNATKILAKEKEVTVNGTSGDVIQGHLKLKVPILPHKEKEKTKKNHPKTLTKIYINLAQVDHAEEASKLDVDGVGLMRAEFMMADIGIHPKLIIEQGKQQEFIETIAKSMIKVLKPFAPRPVVYRATDFKSNEYSHLKGGERYEPKEENPMIGFRGASRYIKWQEVFDMELEAIKLVRSKGYTNIYLMIPFIRTPVELMQIKTILKQHGLDQSNTFKLWVMVEVPSAVIMLEDIISLGIDGVSIGTNDLTMLLLGVDRDSHEVAHIYSEQNDAVMWALRKIVKTARKHNITVSVCGQAPSDYPDIAESLVRWGATSLSLNEDAVDRTRELIAQLEGKLWHSLKR